MGMTINNFIECLPYYFQTKLTPFLWGKHGIGKSQCINQFAEQHGLNFIDIRLGQFEVGDLLGLPRINNVDETIKALFSYLKMKDAVDTKKATVDDIEKELGNFVKGLDLGEDAVTEYAMPKWLKMALEGNCLILWDEINRAKLDVIQAVFQAVLDRQMHLFKFPETTYQVCASNPNIDEYVVTDITDAAFISRFGHVVLVPSAQDWMKYAAANKFHMSVINLVRHDPAMFGAHECELPVDLGPNPRAFEFVSRMAKLTEKNKEEFRGQKLEPLKMEYFQEVTKGILGLKAATAYFEILNAPDKPVPGKDVIKKYKDVRETILRYAGKTEEGIVQQDLLKVSQEQVIKELLKKDAKKWTKGEVANTMEFLKDLPNDMSIAGIRELTMNPERGEGWLDVIEFGYNNGEMMKRVHIISNQKGNKEK